MATIDIQTLTVGRGTYRIAAYQPETTGLQIRFEMMPGDRLVDLILSHAEVELLVEMSKAKVS